MLDNELFKRVIKVRDSLDVPRKIKERMEKEVNEDVDSFSCEEEVGKEVSEKVEHFFHNVGVRFDDMSNQYVVLLFDSEETADRFEVATSEDETEALELARKLASVLQINFKGMIEEGIDPEGEGKGDAETEDVKIEKLTEQEEEKPEDVLPSSEPEEIEEPEMEEPEEPEKEAPKKPFEPEVPEITKEYVGNTEDDHYYLVTVKDEEGELEDLLIVNQEGAEKFSAKANSIPVENVPEFLFKGIKELQIESIEFGVFDRYLYPYVFENEEEEAEGEAEEEVEEETGEELEKLKEPVESKIGEQGISNSLVEMKITDHENNVFDVFLVADDETTDTVIEINGKEFRFDADFASFWRDEEGNLSEEGLKQLALDALANMEEEEYHELVARALEQQKDEGSEEPTVEGRTRRGVRDGTGPYKYSAQRKRKGNIGRRKERGEKCPKESKEMKK